MLYTLQLNCTEQPFIFLLCMFSESPKLCVWYCRFMHMRERTKFITTAWILVALYISLLGMEETLRGFPSIFMQMSLGTAPIWKIYIQNMEACVLSNTPPVLTAGFAGTGSQSGVLTENPVLVMAYLRSEFNFRIFLALYVIEESYYSMLSGSVYNWRFLLFNENDSGCLCCRYKIQHMRYGHGTGIKMHMRVQVQVIKYILLEIIKNVLISTRHRTA